METNPYFVLDAQHGRRTSASRKQDRYRAKAKKTRREHAKFWKLRDAKDAEYKKLHCHEILQFSAAGALRASVWNEDCLELRRGIIEHYSQSGGDDEEKCGYEDDEHGGGWQEGGNDWSLSAAVPTPIITDKEEIEALIRNKEKFIEYCRSIIDLSEDEFFSMIPDVQRCIESREILVKLNMKECCQGTAAHATLLRKVEDYCRSMYSISPSKMLITIEGSISQYEMDEDYDDYSPTQETLHTNEKSSADNVNNMNECDRRREMIQFYKDCGYRILPWQLCVEYGHGWGHRNVGAYSKHLSDPALDIDGERFHLQDGDLPEFDNFAGR